MYVVVSVNMIHECGVGMDLEGDGYVWFAVTGQVHMKKLTIIKDLTKVRW